MRGSQQKQKYTSFIVSLSSWAFSEKKKKERFHLAISTFSQIGIWLPDIKLPFSIPKQSPNPYNDCINIYLESGSSPIYYMTTERLLNKSVILPSQLKDIL